MKRVTERNREAATRKYDRKQFFERFYYKSYLELRPDIIRQACQRRHTEFLTLWEIHVISDNFMAWQLPKYEQRNLQLRVQECHRPNISFDPSKRNPCMVGPENLHTDTKKAFPTVHSYVIPSRLYIPNTSWKYVGLVVNHSRVMPMKCRRSHRSALYQKMRTPKLYVILKKQLPREWTANKSQRNR